MWRSESFFRITLEVAYALCIVTLLFLFFGSEVCGRIPILKLALVIVALDSLANFFGGVSNRVFLPGRAGVGYALFSSLFVGGLVGYLPFWLFQGYGHYRFEYTLWNASCLFAEGHAITFPMICAPALAAITFCREICVAIRFRFTSTH